MQNQKLSFTAKIGLCLLLTNITAISVVALVSYWTSAKSLEHSASNLLKGIQKSKQGEVETYFKLKANQVKALASFPFTISAMKEFKEAHNHVVTDLQLTPEQFEQYRQKLKDYYDNQFIKKLNTSVDKPERTEDYFPLSNDSIVLQNFYIVDNPYPLGSKDKLNEHADASAYSALHARYHPIFHDYLLKFNFYDLFLIDPDTLTDVYTVFKEIDFGINFKVPGEEKNTFSKLIEKIRAAETKEVYDLVDFFPYGPSYAAPAAFAATPIFDQDKLIGILAAQLPIEELESIVTDHRKWEEVGLGKTGETFLVGKDYLLRSNPRLFIENPTKYFETLEALGTPARTIDRIRIYNTAIALQEVTTRSVKLLVQGQNGIITENNWQDKKALSAYVPLDIHDLNWGMVTTMEIKEIYAPIGALKWPFIIFLGLFAVFLVIIFFFLVRSIRGSLHALSLSIEHLDTLPLEQTYTRGDVGNLSDLLKKMIKDHQELQEVRKKLPEITQVRFSEQVESILGSQAQIGAVLAHLQLLKGDLMRTLENSGVKMSELGSLSSQAQDTMNQFFETITQCNATARTLETIQHDLTSQIVSSQEKTGVSKTLAHDFEQATTKLMISLDRLQSLGQTLKNMLTAEIATGKGVTDLYKQTEIVADQLQGDLEQMTKLNQQYAVLAQLYSALEHFEQEMQRMVGAKGTNQPKKSKKK